MSITAEKIAKVIAPWAFDSLANFMKKWALYNEVKAREDQTLEKLEALDKARSILALPQQDEPEGWRPIETAPKDGRRILLWWRTCTEPITGSWCIDDTYDDRPKGWNSPEQGWCADGDQCIPRNQKDCTNWMPLPPAPGAETGAKPDFEHVQKLREKRPSGESGYTDALWTLHDKLTDLKERDAVREAISVMTSSSRQAVLEEAAKRAIEHGEYLAKGIEHFKEFLNKQRGTFNIEDQDGLTDNWRGLDCLVHDFRKRAARALATTPPAEGETK